MIDLLFVIMRHHETPINKRQTALTAEFVDYMLNAGFKPVDIFLYNWLYRDIGRFRCRQSGGFCQYCSPKIFCGTDR
jgi:hypothetical protein